MITVEFRCSIDHEARGPVQCRPGHQKSQRLKQAVIVLSIIERASLGIDVVEVRKPLRFESLAKAALLRLGLYSTGRPCHCSAKMRTSISRQTPRARSIAWWMS